MSRTDTGGVAGPTEGLPGPNDPPFVQLASSVPVGSFGEADALADAVLDAMPAIRESVVARVPVRDRPNAAFDAINDALVRYLRARRAR